MVSNIVNIILYTVLLLFLVRFNYFGALGRIERRKSNLGPVSAKEEAFSKGTHKKLALRQSIIGAFIYTFLVYLILQIIF